MTDFATQRHEAESRLADLRRQGGAAILDGTKFDDAEITKTEHKIDALGQAEAEVVKRERAAESARLAALHKTLTVELRDKEASRLVLVGQAEKSARELVEALTDIQAVCAAERGVIQRMGRPGLIALSTTDLSRRLGERLAATLSTLPGNTQRLGAHVQWNSTWHEPDKSWVEAERVALSPNLEQLKEF